MKKSGHRAGKFAAYPRLNPLGVGRNISAADLIDDVMLAYNGGRLREAAKLYAEKMLPDDGFIGMSLTGANLYHDLHYGLNMELYAGSPFLDDVALHRDGVIRIYDVLFDYNVLLDTDAFVREVIQGPEFQRNDRPVLCDGALLGLRNTSFYVNAR